MPDDLASEFEKFMMTRQKTAADLNNANLALNQPPSQKLDMASWILSCQSIHQDDLEKFYAFISEEVKVANVDDRAFDLLRIYREQAMNFYFMAIPNAYHQNLSACPEKYFIRASQDACFRDCLIKAINYVQLTKARGGKYIDALTTNRMNISSTTPEEKRRGGFLGLFKR
jgi:hypothetical protein